MRRDLPRNKSRRINVQVWQQEKLFTIAVVNYVTPTNMCQEVVANLQTKLRVALRGHQIRLRQVILISLYSKKYGDMRRIELLGRQINLMQTY